MKTILAIAAGQYFSRKESSLVQSRLNYLNFGLLGLCTMIKRYSGRSIVMFQGHDTVEKLLQEIEGTGICIASDCECILLSVPSYYSLSWCRRLCEAIKNKCQIPIIVGGRWVVDGHVAWIQEKLKYVDLIVEGFGEGFYSEYFGFKNAEMEFDGSKQLFELLDYTILHGYHKYQPCIEISRGCGFGCDFCVDRNYKRLPNKSPQQMAIELDHLDQLYGNGYSVYFEAPHFVFDPHWVEDFCNKAQIRTYIAPWRCTTRVESVPLDGRLEQLHASGLKIIDVGLESASPLQLLRMKKTTNPKRYLDSAEKLLEKCHDHDIWVKFNLLLYAGETMETLNETIQWLSDRNELIKSVSVSGVTYYYNMGSLSSLCSLGASIVDEKSIESKGYAVLNLSPELPYEKVRQLCLQIPRMISTQKDYFDVKSISYFDIGYTYKDFLRDVAMCNPDDLPFRIERGE